jgi:DNA-binding transcriptional LysR family regulator
VAAGAAVAGAAVAAGDGVAVLPEQAVATRAITPRATAKRVLTLTSSYESGSSIPWNRYQRNVPR